MKISFLPEWLKNGYLKLLTPIIDQFIRYKLNPNWFTTIGLIFSVVAAYFFAIGRHSMGGAIFLLAGTFDIIDGKVARATGRVTKFGALYDSTLDRYAELIIFFGLIYYFVQPNPTDFKYPEWSFTLSIATAVAIGGSVMVSYIRARAEGLGLECKVGLMQRPERVVFLGVGAIFHQLTLIIAILLIAVLSNLTAIQRLVYLRKQAKGKLVESTRL
ncbi:CDP-alcohol phosphatidyltransferase family protein [candidate division KSB1 bacterium]|nr:CDP-alcohol phosphatidyltransferase family protein [candidate division KSB1 bacterium]